MSRIITQLSCKKCNAITNTYISFGHPKNDFDFKWVCEKCKAENIEKIEATPYSQQKFYTVFKACESCHYNTPYMCGLDYDIEKGIAYCPDAKGETIPFDEARKKADEAREKYVNYEESFSE